MKKYDHIVVGSGISGLSAALLLAQGGKRVLVVEKAAELGGSLLRFRRGGIPFDTGFHFTGGLQPGGLLTRMLECLGLEKAIIPLFPRGDCSQRVVFEQSGSLYTLPSGIDALRTQLALYFPGEKEAIEGYFDRLTAIYQASEELLFQEGDRGTPIMGPEADISLQAVLEDLTPSDNLRTLLGIFCLCHGAAPAEVSFVAHSLVSYSLFESQARVENGGEAFIRAFQARFQELGVEVLCNTEVVHCGEIVNRVARSFHLSTGEEVAFESAVLTIHPRDIVAILPPELLRPAFVHRVNEFEDSTGFFSIFATLDLPEDDVDYAGTILLPSADLNCLLRSGGKESAVVLIRNRERVQGRTVHTLTAFEPAFPDDVAQWRDTETGQRPSDYEEYKERRAARMVERILAVYPEFRGKFKLLDTASALTYRDWLHSPTGAAYGIKQKPGQMNLLGKLPVINLFAAGQSAVLPGIVGAMTSAFVACRGMSGISTQPTLACH